MKTGIALTFLQWDKLKSAMLFVEELNRELDEVSFCEEFHQNQEGALTCSNCNPNDFMNHCRRFQIRLVLYTFV